jgi:hypothetical protein
MSESEFRFRLESLEKDASEQTKEFKEFRKIMYERFSNVEGHMHRIPTVEESNLMKEAAEYFKAKKELTTRVQEALITKGILAAAVVTGAAVLFYLKTLLTGGTP